MTCECREQSADTEAERRTLRIALGLNTAMFLVGTAVGLWAHSTGLLADALDMLADAAAYAIALMAVTRGLAFKKNAARASGGVLLILGLGIVGEVARRWFAGSGPQAIAMMVFSLASLAVNVSVLRMLSRFRQGEVHLRTTWLFTRVDVIANVAVFASGALVQFTGSAVFDLAVGFLIGLYVIKESLEILSEAGQAE